MMTDNEFASMIIGAISGAMIIVGVLIVVGKIC